MRPYKIPEDDQDFTRLHRTAYLIASFIEGRITTSERDELDQWIEASQENLLFFEEATDENRLIESINWFQQLDMEKVPTKSRTSS
jgi:ferric-dicitrate binding protein FerR (iron transport regulator)